MCFVMLIVLTAGPGLSYRRPIPPDIKVLDLQSMYLGLITQSYKAHIRPPNFNHRLRW